jgi:hypothetical protein
MPKSLQSAKISSPQYNRSANFARNAFDIVPDSFESALYLDLMHMLEKGGVDLRCSHCGLPIPYDPHDQTGRANRQRFFT